MSRHLRNDAPRRRAGRQRTNADGRRRGRSLAVESLESRMMLYGAAMAGMGVPDLTISFAPDGTSVAGQTSAVCRP